MKEDDVNNEKDLKILDIRQAAKYLDVSIYTLRNWDNAGKLVAQKTPGGLRKYRLVDLEEFLKQNDKNSKQNVYFKELRENFRSDNRNEMEMEIDRLTRIVENYESSKLALYEEISKVKNTYLQMYNMLKMCRTQMLPLDLAKQIDSLLIDVKQYIE